jgi:hypothetical protein
MDENFLKMLSDSGIDPEAYMSQQKKAAKYRKAYYDTEHIYCPECGCDRHSSTYMGYIINVLEAESFKDENRVQCSDCKWVGITHDLVRKKPKRKNV